MRLVFVFLLAFFSLAVIGFIDGRELTRSERYIRAHFQGLIVPVVATDGSIYLECPTCKRQMRWDVERDEFIVHENFSVVAFAPDDPKSAGLGFISMATLGNIAIWTLKEGKQAFVSKGANAKGSVIAWAILGGVSGYSLGFWFAHSVMPFDEDNSSVRNWLSREVNWQAIEVQLWQHLVQRAQWIEIECDRNAIRTLPGVTEWTGSISSADAKRLRQRQVNADMFRRVMVTCGKWKMDYQDQNLKPRFEDSTFSIALEMWAQAVSVLIGFGVLGFLLAWALRTKRVHVPFAKRHATKT